MLGRSQTLLWNAFMCRAALHSSLEIRQFWLHMPNFCHFVYFPISPWLHKDKFLISLVANWKCSSLKKNPVLKWRIPKWHHCTYNKYLLRAYSEQGNCWTIRLQSEPDAILSIKDHQVYEFSNFKTWFHLAWVYG